MIFDQGNFDAFKNFSSTVTHLQPRAESGVAKGATPLHWAALNGHLPIVTYVTNCLTDINPSEDNGENVMMWAAEKGQVEIVNFYLEKLKDDKNPPRISTDEFNGRTPLHHAAQFGKLEVVKAITQVLDDKNPRDVHGLTPFHMAALNGHLPVVECLFQFVEDVDIKTDDYWDNETALLAASKRGHLDIVQFLTAKGADSRDAIFTHVVGAENEPIHEEVFRLK